MSLICSHCLCPADPDDTPSCLCKARLIDSRLHYEREQESAWAVEQRIERYHAVSAGAVELPEPTPNYLRVRQAS